MCSFSQFQSSIVDGTITDPLECLFGEPESIKEINQSDNIGIPPRRRSRAQRKASRGRHQAHQSESADSYAD